MKCGKTTCLTNNKGIGLDREGRHEVHGPQ